MEKTDLLKRLAYLEFVNDQLSTEVVYIDNLLKAVGFPEGMQSVKLIAHELINEQVELE